MELDSIIRGPSGDTSWLKKLREETSAKTVLPLYIEDEDDFRVVAAVIVLNDNIRTIYSSPVGWQQLANRPLTNTPHVHVESLESPVVSFTGEDAATAREVAYELGDRIEELHGIVFSSYQQSPQRFEELGKPDGCDCSGIGSSSVKRIEGVSFVDEDRVFLCSHSVVHGIEYRGKKQSLQAILVANWMFGGESIGKIVDLQIDGDEDYGVYSATGSENRADRVVATLNMLGMIETTTPFSKYDPEHHHALIYVQGDDVAGYLTWENLDEFQTLRQLFVREDYRTCGIASTLIRTWCNQFCSSKTYYVDEANNQGQAVFESLGHINGASEYSAVDLHALRGTGNSLENAEIIRE